MADLLCVIGHHRGPASRTGEPRDALAFGRARHAEELQRFQKLRRVGYADHPGAIERRLRKLVRTGQGTGMTDRQIRPNG